MTGNLVVDPEGWSKGAFPPIAIVYLFLTLYLTNFVTNFCTFCTYTPSNKKIKLKLSPESATV